MGLFGKRRAGVESAAPSAAIDGIDLSAYDLKGLAADVRSIVSVPGAIAQAAKYALSIPLIIAAVTWLVFRSRMAGWVLVPFTAVALALAFLGALVLGGYFVARKRLDTVEQASERVVTMLGEMHVDLTKARSTDTTVQQVAVGLLDDAVLPIVFGALGDGIIARTVTKAPMNLVKKTVIAAVTALPDRQLGQLVDQAADSVGGIADRLPALTAQYEGLKNNLTPTVHKISTRALGSILTLTIVAWIPLFLWLLLGLVLS